MLASFTLLVAAVLGTAMNAHGVTAAVNTTSGLAPSPLKVMSFNLRTSVANDPCPSGCWEERKWRGKQLVDRYQPDFIGTQEGAPDQIEFFETVVGYAGIGECAGDCQWNERNSIFYRADRWHLMEGYTFALSDTPEVLGSNTWDLQYLRAAVLARFMDKRSRNTVCILNTHFDISRGHELSSMLVAERMSQFCKPTDTVLMTGDLNTPPVTPAIKYLVEGSFLNGQKSPIALYDTLTAAGAGGSTWIGGSYGSVTTGDKLDYILSRRDSQTCLLGAQILLDTFDGYTSSDHAVVMSELCIGAGCCNCL